MTCQPARLHCVQLHVSVRTRQEREGRTGRARYFSSFENDNARPLWEGMSIVFGMREVIR